MQVHAILHEVILTDAWVRQTEAQAPDDNPSEVLRLGLCLGEHLGPDARPPRYLPGSIQAH